MPALLRSSFRYAQLARPREAHARERDVAALVGGEERGGAYLDVDGVDTSQLARTNRDLQTERMRNLGDSGITWIAVAG